ncbi:hypothetical protein [Mariniradius saccharolyticus]|uniref:hypothetical protein n=1 Tax=Mariniradius saccharolyticus TaxID=1245591 RepID=UPI0012F6AAD4|nr:hypothetical protein [Mariniradius saccharolyticus]
MKSKTSAPAQANENGQKNGGYADWIFRALGLSLGNRKISATLAMYNPTHSGMIA